MSKKMRRGFRRGVASFYIVAFSTLILTVVSVGFATVILSEVTRTANDDLSQSAYDSALAGIEDAKLAYSNYRRCRERTSVAREPNGDGVVTCEEIIYWMQNPDCYMVGRILGRLSDNSEPGEVKVGDVIQTSSGSTTDEMNQAYTCVEIRTEQEDYRAGLSSANSNRMIALNFDKIYGENGERVTAGMIEEIRLSWYLTREDMNLNFANYLTTSSGRVAFLPAKSVQVASPPAIELQLVQTANNFRLTDFDRTVNGQTDRATLFLVPIGRTNAANDATAKAIAGRSGNSYDGVYKGDDTEGNPVNLVSSAQVAKTNDRYISNKPFGLYCSEEATQEFTCSVRVQLPEAVGGGRSNETFMFVLNLPYGQPDTEFAMEFYYRAADGNLKRTTIRDAQVVVDSTGRTNDLVRRVEVRLETSDTSFAYPMYALQLLGNEGTLTKDMTVTSEYNFYK
ncbi:hypothetical protein IJH33_00925 [Candidatus Saccharibacteria bacterium]|nr:hypothetical protein [Candidatus Saccharibacteria bacterium]